MGSLGDVVTGLFWDPSCCWNSNSLVPLIFAPDVLNLQSHLSLKFFLL